MPELPEVETICRQLRPEVCGRTIVEARVLDDRWSRPEPPSRIERGLAGRRIESVDRRGKYLLLGLDDGSTLLMHLRMTGNLVLDERRLGGERLYAARDENRYLRAALLLDDGRALRFTDPRRFGHGTLLGPGDREAYLADRLGTEPLTAELTPALIGRLAAGRTAPLKSFLLDQRAIAGIGNIYADEALHRAGLHPISPAGSMRGEHCRALRDGIIEALEAGIRYGGSSIDDYRDARGEEGTMQEEFLVHNREGAPCPRCGGAVARIVVGGRSTYFCPGCQVRLRRRPSRRGRRRSR